LAQGQSPWKRAPLRREIFALELDLDAREAADGEAVLGPKLSGQLTAVVIKGEMRGEGGRELDKGSHNVEQCPRGEKETERGAGVTFCK
jgi:hypothetical protein